MLECDVLVLGAGAAGLFAGAEAARRGRRVIVVEHMRAPGEKIRISGGGRCNFTNLATRTDRFISENPKFAASALGRFGPGDFLARVERAGIVWHEKAAGQLFCDGSARQIVDMLVSDLRAAEGRLILSCAVQSVARGPDGFAIATSTGPVRARSVVVATGGKSIPKIGASGIGYRIAEDFGLKLVPTRPGLVPLTFAEQDLAALRPMAGIAVPARVEAGRVSFEEPLLFTHRGLSGPAILQISSYLAPGEDLRVDLLPGRDLAAELASLRATGGRQAIANVLARFLPEKLADWAAARAGVEGRLADQPRAAITRLAEAVHAWRVCPVGSEGYRTAEVTLGGVDTDALSSRDMQVRAIPGLYFVGEVVDVTGWLGGYNFQWAWSSGWAAGQVA